MFDVPRRRGSPTVRVAADHYERFVLVVWLDLGSRVEQC